MQLPYNPIIYLKEMKADVCTKTSAQEFIGALCIREKYQKEPTYLKRMNGYTVVHTYHRTLLSNKKEWPIDSCKNLCESPENYAESKKKKKASPNRLYTL